MTTTPQMGNQASHMAGYLLFDVLISKDVYKRQIIACCCVGILCCETLTLVDWVVEL